MVYSQSMLRGKCQVNLLACITLWRVACDCVTSWLIQCDELTVWRVGHVTSWLAANLATTLFPAMAQAFSSTNPSHSYLPLFMISLLLNHLPLLSKFLALKHPYLSSTVFFLHPLVLNHSQFFSKTLIFCFFSLLPHLMNPSSPVNSTFILIIQQITLAPTFYLFCSLSTC